MQLDDAGYWDSPTQCRVSDELVRQRCENSKLLQENHALRITMHKLKGELNLMRNGIVRSRERTWPGTNQGEVIDRDFPLIAKFLRGE